MTHRPIETLPDGTRVYQGGHRYKPKAPEERVYGVNKPDDPRAVRFHGNWYLPLDLLPDEERVMPVTKPDLTRDWPKGAHRARALRYG